ncbi:MAG: glycosyltransferase family 39 protein [Candidatus Micrarchaeota archaeon]|nr:glycosyltransferase family 39 protein [Candidatus Micrarchaeota archaeon]
MMLHPRFDRYGIALLALMVIAFFLSTYFFYGPSPINGADNYLYAQFAHILYQGGFTAVAQDGILAQQYILLYGISAFYAMFGVSRISEAGFGILSFMLTILVVYKIGMVLYNRNAGIISAAVFALNPIAIVNSSYVGDNGPMALFVSLTVLFLIMGITAKDRRQLYFILSGFLSIIGILVTSQVLELFPFIIIVLAAYLIKSRAKFLPRIGLFFLGAILGVGVLALFGIAGSNGPLYILTLNSSTYSSVQMPSVQFFQYLQWLFPYSMVANLTSSVTTVISHQSFAGFSKMLYVFLNPTSANTYFSANESDGLYGYFAAAAIVFLIAKWNKRMLIPLAWFIPTLLYMGLGSVSLTHYVPIGFAYARLMLIFIPAMSLLIGFAFADFLENKRDGMARFFSYLIAIGLVGLLAANSVALVNYINMSQYAYVYPLLQIAGFVNMLPHNTAVFTTAPIGPYVGYDYDIFATPPADQGCRTLTGGDYLVLEGGNATVSQCGLARVYSPEGAPSYLGRYNLFDNSGFGAFGNYSVYVLR